MSTDDALQSPTSDPEPAATVPATDTLAAPVDAPLEPTAPATPTTPAEPVKATEPAEGSKPTDSAVVQDGTPAKAVEEPSAPSTKIMEYLDSIGGTFAAKYASDAEALTGVVNMQRLIGQRDEDAQYGRQVRSYEKEFHEFLKAYKQQPPGQQPPPQQPQPLEYTYEQVQAWRQEIELARAGGNEPHPETMRHYQAAVEATNRRTFELANSQQPQVTREQIQQQVQQGVQEQFTAARGQEELARQHMTYANTFERDNAHWIYTDGDPSKTRTPQGQRFFAAAEYYAKQGAPPAVAIKEAWAQIGGEFTRQQPQATLSVSPQATRQPEVAISPVEEETSDKLQKRLIDKFGFSAGMSRFAEEMDKRQQ